MFCPQCGSQIKEGATFCSECGERISGSGSTPVAAPASTPVRVVQKSKSNTKKIVATVTSIIITTCLMGVQKIVRRGSSAPAEQGSSAPVEQGTDAPSYSSLEEMVRQNPDTLDDLYEDMQIPGLLPPRVAVISNQIQYIWSVPADTQSVWTADFALAVLKEWVLEDSTTDSEHGSGISWLEEITGLQGITVAYCVTDANNQVLASLIFSDQGLVVS